MRAIGFSTGALAKGDFRRGLQLAGGGEAIELSALRDNELAPLVAALPSLDLGAFAYVSVHAPSRTLSEETIFSLLRDLPWPIVAHPEILITPSLWRSLGARLCIENMDDRKTTGRTVAELHELFATYPAATFCLALGHARQVDPTMASAVAMLREFGDRLSQIHISDVGPRGEHRPLGDDARKAFAKILRQTDCPLIIESVVAEDRIAHELDTVRQL